MTPHYSVNKSAGLSPWRWVVWSTWRGSRWCLVILWCSVLVWWGWVWSVWWRSCAWTWNVGAWLHCWGSSSCISSDRSRCRNGQRGRVCWRKCRSHWRMWICAILIVSDNFRSFITLIMVSFSVAWYHVWLKVLCHFYRNSCKEKHSSMWYYVLQGYSWMQRKTKTVSAQRNISGTFA